MATSMFAKFGNIKGECEAHGHEEWCEITSLEQTFTIKDEEEGSNPQRAKHSPIAIKKVIDKASAALLKCCRDGKPLEEVIIECVRAHVVAEGEAPLNYFQITLKNVIVNEFEYRVNEGELVSEELKLVARKATYGYRELKKRGGAMPTYLAFMERCELRDQDFGDAPSRGDGPAKKLGRKYRDLYARLDRDGKLDEEQKKEFATLTEPGKKEFIDRLISKDQG